jgi:flavin reductase (DIM6/NTAB) family NADH-FMN oxidoreductase RutF
METFRVEPENLNENVFRLIGKDWMLVTAGDINKFNTMTAAWGGMGVLWHKNVCYIFIRPQRYTFEFIEKFETFTLSFFEEKYRDVLKFCGSKSGRDTNKVEKTGITPKETPNGSIYFDEAKIILDCKKLYFQDIDPSNFSDKSIDKLYPQEDYHRMYIGEILGCYIK